MIFANPVGNNVQTKIKYISTCQFFHIEYVANFIIFAWPSGAALERRKFTIFVGCL